MPDSYQAVVFSRYGDAEVLDLLDLAVPEPGCGQVRIGVRAAAVNPIDWKIRSGALADVMPVELPHVPGIDVAGVIEAVGEDAQGFAVGDEVLGKALAGSYGEKALAQVDRIAAKPTGLAWELAAALPVAATTAHHALDLLNLTPGETLVIDGASGGVGTLAVQLARRRGATVIGTASETNHTYLRSLGAIPVRYGTDLGERIAAMAPGGVDAALDTAGHGSLPELISLTGDPDRVVTLADFSAGQLGARFIAEEPGDMPEILAEVAGLAAAGAITVPLTSYRLADSAAAHRASEAGHVRGKLVLVPD
ncbi:NADP-dependent oxidoreductase [Nonomuraea sp. NPDC052265]|uniref:NADP-dependent oxidoreductase n=1 Tax=Nonomuraea sp. NPDC052265 TaxID=3364374 RepID=UPI0037C8461B